MVPRSSLCVHRVKTQTGWAVFLNWLNWNCTPSVPLYILSICIQFSQQASAYTPKGPCWSCSPWGTEVLNKEPCCPRTHLYRAHYYCSGFWQVLRWVLMNHRFIQTCKLLHHWGRLYCILMFFLGKTALNPIASLISVRMREGRKGTVWLTHCCLDMFFPNALTTKARIKAVDVAQWIKHWLLISSFSHAKPVCHTQCVVRETTFNLL